jgi:hypothetical protein
MHKTTTAILTHLLQGSQLPTTHIIVLSKSIKMALTFLFVTHFALQQKHRNTFLKPFIQTLLSMKFI